MIGKDKGAEGDEGGSDEDEDEDEGGLPSSQP
jgi:hypothetical protein